MGAAVLFNYWFLRATAAPVAYLNDSSVHEQMVRFATARIEAGHLPQTSWFPYLGLGSPQFLHYQGLPATLTGLVGVVIGPDRAFAWSLFLLLSLWPLSVYVGARAFRLGRWSAAGASLLSPLLISHVGIGFETIAYVWTGFGVWAQLWAMLMLPLAWGFSWQAITEGRRYFLAVLFVSLTVMFHFETGYLALIPLALFPILVPSVIRARFARAAIVAGSVLLVTAWVTVPLLLSTSWASVNEILRGTPLENGYGARQVMTWLFSGQLLDAGRLPVITILAGLGLVVCVVRFRMDERGRAVLLLLILSLLLSFGRTTFGPLVEILPGSTDIFMRRFMMGVQLASLLLAGIGLATAGTFVADRARRRWPGIWTSREPHRWLRRSVLIVAPLVLLGVLAPAWSQMVTRDQQNAQAIGYQQMSDSSQGSRIAPLLDRIRRSGNGRVYAGLPDNWGARFTVGEVPVFKYVESQDIDEVGYTLRTASLMTDPEFFFDERNIGDYSVFGVRYILEPAGRPPPVAARLVMLRVPYALWELPSAGYMHVAGLVGTESEDRSDVGLRSVSYLRSALPAKGETLAVAYSGSRPGSFSPDSRHDESAGGAVLAERVALAQGRAHATVQLHRKSVVVLSASFDPGWHVQVDGKDASAFMVAPALVAVTVGPGRHRIDFSYVGFRYYVPLLILSGGSLLIVLLSDKRRSARRRPGPDGRSGPSARSAPGASAP